MSVQKNTGRGRKRKYSVPRPRNGGTWTEAEYWSRVRSHLRRAFKYWKPAMDCKLAARRPNQSDNKRLKWEYQCNHCKQWFPEKEIQVDHVIECGSLKSADDLVGFLERLTPEDVNAYQVLCKPCHKARTQEQRRKK